VRCLGYSRGYLAGVLKYFRNITALVPTAVTIQLMKYSAKANRQFRSLKQALDPELRKTQYKMATLLAQMDNQEKRFNDASATIRNKINNGESVEQNLTNGLKIYKLSYRKTKEDYIRTDRVSDALIQQLKDAEKVWMKTSRRLTDEIDAALVDSGVLQDIDDNIMIVMSAT
jgi:hypothetical protein